MYLPAHDPGSAERFGAYAVAGALSKPCTRPASSPATVPPTPTVGMPAAAGG